MRTLKSVKKTITIFLLLLLISSLAACNDGKIWFHAEYLRELTIETNDLEILIHTFEEFELLCNTHCTYGLEYDEELNEYIRPPIYYLKDLPETYDENFFSEKSLILYLFIETSGGKSTKIDSVQVKDNCITVNATRTTPSPNSHVTLGIELHSIYIELKKADVEGITDMQIISKDKQRR